MEVNIYVDTTIKAPNRGTGKSMFLLECPKYPDYVKTGFFELDDTTEDRLTLITAILALNRIKESKDPSIVKIYTKCNGVYYNIESGRWLDYKAAGWRNSKGNQIMNAELWMILEPMLQKHQWTVTQEDHSYMTLMKSELSKWQRA